MTSTSRLALPIIESNQAQKHITHNEALRIVDAMLHLTIDELHVNDPPASPQIGQIWVVGATPTGVWALHDKKIASFDSDGWQYLDPKHGMVAWVKSDQELFVFHGSNWSRLDQAPSAIANAQYIGIGAVADTYNRLAVKAEAAFLSAQDGGSGDTRFSLNKTAKPNTASLVFNSTWSARAEMGLSGNDDFAIKVSSDGSQWKSAASFDSASGEFTLQQGLSPNSKSVANKLNLLADSGRFASEKTTQISGFVQPTYLQMENGATISHFSQFVSDSSDYGGPNAANEATTKLLVDQIREPASARNFAEFHVAKISAGLGTAFPNNQGALSKYRMCSYDRIGRHQQSFSAYIYVLSGTVILSAANHLLWLSGSKIDDFSELTSSDGWQHVNAIVDYQPRFASQQVAEILPLFASLGDEILLALPAIMPDAVRVGPDEGIIPSLTVAV